MNTDRLGTHTVTDPRPAMRTIDRARERSTTRFKLGTYSATLGAGNWVQIIDALCDARDAAIRCELPQTADDIQRNINRLLPQVTEES